MQKNPYLAIGVVNKQIKWECSIWRFVVFLALGKIYIWQLCMISFFCVIFFRKQGRDRYLSKIKEFLMAMIIMKVFYVEGNIFLTSLCMISLFSCHSGKQGCGRYLSKTQRISNNIKIVLHPSLQAAISFSCCFIYHWKFLMEALDQYLSDNIFCAIDKSFQFNFSLQFVVVNCAQLLRSYNPTSNNF